MTLTILSLLRSLFITGGSAEIEKSKFSALQLGSLLSVVTHVLNEPPNLRGEKQLAANGRTNPSVLLVSSTVLISLSTPTRTAQLAGRLVKLYTGFDSLTNIFWSIVSEHEPKPTKFSA